MFATIRIARVLSPESFGLYGVVQINAGLGVILAGLGLHQVTMRECARDPERSLSLFRSSIILQTLMYFPVGTALLIYSIWVSGNISISLGGVTLILLYGLMIWQLTESVAFGYERMEYSSILNFIGSLFWVIFAWATPTELMSTIVVCVVFTLLQIIKSGSYLFCIIKAGFLQKAKEAGTIKFLLKKSVPFYWLSIFTAAVNQLPILFLADRSGAFEVGLYSAGMKLASPMQMMVQTLLLTLYPSFSKISISNQDHYLLIIQRSLLFLVTSAAILASFITIFRLEIINLLFGKRYLGAATSLVLQVWYFTLLCIFNLIGITLAASDRQNWLVKLSTLYTIVALPLIWLGSAHGAKGLAAAMLLSALANMTYHWYVFQKSLPKSLLKDFTITVFSLPLLLSIASYQLSPDIPILFRSLGFISLLGLILVTVLKQANKLEMISKS